MSAVGYTLLVAETATTSALAPIRICHPNAGTVPLDDASTTMASSSLDGTWDDVELRFPLQRDVDVEP
jgi:hypothetical protein